MKVCKENEAANDFFGRVIDMPRLRAELEITGNLYVRCGLEELAEQYGIDLWEETWTFSEDEAPELGGQAVRYLVAELDGAEVVQVQGWADE